MRKLRTRGIRMKIATILLLSVATLAAVNVMAFSALSATQDQFHALKGRQIKLADLTDAVKSDIYRLQNQMVTGASMLRYGGEGFAGDVEGLRKTILANLEGIRSLAATFGNRRLEVIGQNLEIRFESFYRMGVDLPELFRNGDEEELTVFMTGLGNVAAKMNQELGELRTFSARNLEEELAGYEAGLEKTRNGMIAVGIASVLALFVVTFWVARRILRSVQNLRTAVRHLAEGDYDLSRRLPLLSRDELGEVTRYLNGFLDTVEEMDDQIRDQTRMLEERVKEELSKNREKDELMIKQSRLAAMGEMIHNIAHQWRQPLNALGLVIQDLRDAYEFGELDDEYFVSTEERGMKLIAKMSQTIDDFRNFFSPDKQVVDFLVSGAFADVEGIVGASLANNGVRLEISSPEELKIHGYPNEFSQVLLNMLVNAKDVLLERNPEEKTIFLRAERQGEEAVIMVEDTGGGIDGAVAEKVFDPYFTTKEEGKGTGIGLYMSKMIVENSMKGRIAVSNGEKGAIFTISFKAH